MTEYSFNCLSSGCVLRRGRDYSFNDAGFALALTANLSPRLADLLDLALAVYVVDRREARPGASELSAGRTWARELVIRIGVRDPQFWRKEGGSVASSLLCGLTDDSWSFKFEEFAGTELFTELTTRLPLVVNYELDCVGLFSGGLDSLAGVLLALEDGRRPLLLSVETNNRMAATQRFLRQKIRRHWPLVCSASASVGLHGDESREPSQRARAFLFLSLAGVVAAAARIRSVEVYENGVGAIGLPYLPNQKGTHTTKAMHPTTLQMMHQLVSCVAGQPVEYNNPSLWLTKAELCVRIPDEKRGMIPLSESCDTAFSYRGEDVARCGKCTSCLLRRQSLWAAGLGCLDNRQQVRVDLVGDGGGDEASAGVQLLCMLDQAERIERALAHPDPWTSLLYLFPELLNVAQSAAEREACLRLYATYVSEWHRFPSHLVDRYLVRSESHASQLVGGRIDA